MDTYLSLVTDFVRETSLSGGSAPDSVISATGDQAKAAYWVKQANNQIQREWLNWDFLWNFITVNLTQGSSIVPSATEKIPVVPGDPATVSINIVNFIKRESLGVIAVDGAAHFPLFQDWNNSAFSRLYTYEDQDVSDFAAHWSMQPNHTILLSEPIESTGLTCKYHYYRKAKQFYEDADIPVIMQNQWALQASRWRTLQPSPSLA